MTPDPPPFLLAPGVARWVALRPTHTQPIGRMRAGARARVRPGLKGSRHVSASLSASFFPQAPGLRWRALARWAEPTAWHRPDRRACAWPDGTRLPPRTARLVHGLAARLAAGTWPP